MEIRGLLVIAVCVLLSACASEQASNNLSSNPSVVLEARYDRILARSPRHVCWQDEGDTRADSSLCRKPGSILVAVRYTLSNPSKAKDVNLLYHNFRLQIGSTVYKPLLGSSLLPESENCFGNLSPGNVQDCDILFGVSKADAWKSGKLLYKYDPWYAEAWLTENMELSQNNRSWQFTLN